LCDVSIGVEVKVKLRIKCHPRYFPKQPTSEIHLRIIILLAPRPVRHITKGDTLHHSDSIRLPAIHRRPLHYHIYYTITRICLTRILPPHTKLPSTMVPTPSRPIQGPVRFARAQGDVLTRSAGANTPTTTSQHALRQGAGEEDGPARASHHRQARRTAEVAHFKDLDQYVFPLPQPHGQMSQSAHFCCEGSRLSELGNLRHCRGEWSGSGATRLIARDSSPRLRTMRRYPL
jgi:hypothetical protein